MVGQERTVENLMVGLLADGHVLLEGAPGLAKTRIARLLATSFEGTFKRIQGTPDLMPTDITGVHVFNSDTRSFEFQPGPLFADVVLVDEINRAGPKTQSALLEAMEERQVSVDRETFALADDFVVVATQNPREFEGTYPLPESQLDRFMLAVDISHAPREEELRILETYNLPSAGRAGQHSLAALERGVVSGARESIANVHLSKDLMGYVLDLAAATRDSSQLTLGLSSRGAVALTRCARIEACLQGHEYVLPDDVKRVAPWVVGHRLVLSSEAVLEGTTAMDVLNHVLDNVEVPR